MCGVSGFFSVHGINDELNSFIKSNHVISHRGPDGYGLAYFQTGSKDGRCVEFALDQDKLPQEQVTLALGHRRLAIIDLSQNGAQPMPTKDEYLWITYNGEIYNYIELSEELRALGHSFRSTSDTEVILAAYAEWGEACVNRFNGIWAFAIADFKNNKLFCSRDRFGVKPFHYFYDGTRFVFGSEIKELLCYSFVPRQVNSRAIYEYLAFSAVDYCEETFFASIYKLMQGHNLTLDFATGKVVKMCYYHPQFGKNVKISYEDAALEFRRLLSDSISLQLRSDVEVGSCLSGGLDSSSIVCLMRQELLKTGQTHVQRTFSSHFEEQEANELEYMQEIIKATNVHAGFTYPSPQDLLHDLEKLVWYQDEPFGSTSIFAQWSVFKLVHENKVKVMLDGQGADEMLAGYVGFYPTYFDQLRDQRQYFTLWLEVYKYAHLHQKPWMSLLGKGLQRILGRLGKPFRPSSFTYRTDWLNPTLTDEFQGQSLYQRTKELTPFGKDENLENTLYQMTFLSNLQALLRHEDRNSMAFSVEARVPFLDHRLVEFIFSLPSRFKIRDGYTKRVLRDGMQGVIPEKIRWRVKKLGFATPERKWQRTALKPLVEAAIQDERLQPYLVARNASDYFSQLQQQQETDFAPWRWLNLSLWMKAYELG
jgi:asparagine synthase (glutamine-hydrolysing)